MREVRKAKMDDLPKLLGIYAFAREFMKKSGNPNQWKDTNPTKAQLVADIKNGHLYLLCDGGEILAAFALIFGADPTYSYIEGEWLTDEDYATLHRVASAGRQKGVFSDIVNYAKSRFDTLRIDTHADNKIMQHLAEKEGFCRCGIIYISDGSPRIAYEYCKNMPQKEQK